MSDLSSTVNKLQQEIHLQKKIIKNYETQLKLKDEDIANQKQRADMYIIEAKNKAQELGLAIERADRLEQELECLKSKFKEYVKTIDIEKIKKFVDGFQESTVEVKA